MISKFELENIEKIKTLSSELWNAVFNGIEDVHAGNEMCRMVTDFQLKLIDYIESKEN